MDQRLLYAIAASLIALGGSGCALFRPEPAPQPETKSAAPAKPGSDRGLPPCPGDPRCPRKTP